MTKQKYVIIVAGGSGKRMGNDLPKQFLVVNNLPVLMHTIYKFYRFSNSLNIIVVLPEHQHSYWQALCIEYNFTIPHKIAKGGKERFFSVKNGLQLVNEDGVVAIHDGVRPLVSEKVIEEGFSIAEKQGAVIPVLPANESIRRIYSNESVAVNRAEYFMVQTPQVFQLSIVKEAYQQEFNSQFTDDASVVEKAGYKVSHCMGNSENIKITQPMDLLIAETLLKKA